MTDLAATEDGASVSGTPTFSDVDATDTHSYTVTAMGTGQGSVAINAGTGVYTVKVNILQNQKMLRFARMAAMTGRTAAT
jgi:hypothetical protein